MRIAGFARTVALITTSLGCAGAAGAENLALVLGNRAYQAGPGLRSAVSAQAMARELRDIGFRVFEGQEMTGIEMQALAGEFAAAVQENPGEDRLVIVLAGHLASAPWGNWLLGGDANAPSALNVGAVGVALEPLAELAASAPGQALMMIARPERTMVLGTGLEAGFGEMDLPQGVTLALGDLGRMESLLTNGFLDPDYSLRDVARMAPSGVTISGFVSGAVHFFDSRSVGPERPAPVDKGETSYWQAAVDIGTVEALLAYVENYPDGQFVEEANRRVGDIRSQPLRRAKADEAELGLSRDARRLVQRNLSLLGFDPKGIDGLFGRGSRAAISRWQGVNGHEPTGYLDRSQISQVQLAAERRAAQLEEEARQRRIEQERNDRAYWENTGKAGDEAGLHAYLERYPDGVFAEVAQARLAAFDEQRRAESEEEERLAWDLAQSGDSIAGYMDFLERYPESGFGDAARARVEELEGEQQNATEIARDKKEESVVAGLAPARLLIEQRLQQMELKPGEVDGEFTDETRRALRRFQREQGLDVTGYVSQETIVRLLAVKQ